MCRSSLPASAPKIAAATNMTTAAIADVTRTGKPWTSGLPRTRRRTAATANHTDSSTSQSPLMSATHVVALALRCLSRK